MSDAAARGSVAGRDTPDVDAASADAPRVQAGTVIGGRYVVEGQLGSGGMGVVVLARHRELGELRAIKLLRADRLPDEAARRRLQREARAAARIQSAHVVRVFDVVTDDPQGPYVVMEHLVGETLAARLRRGPLAVATTARLVVEACEAVDEAHRNGTIHRDLKPSNLFMTTAAGRDEIVKVLDFGIAKTEEARFGGDPTHSCALLATPAYASPEQLRASRDVDPRSDIWSLGVLMYECLTGRLPFEGGTLAETASRILRDEPSPMRDARPDLPVEIERVVARCLQKDREARFPNVEALVEALSPFAPAAAAACLDRLRALPRSRAEVSPPPLVPPSAVPAGETLSQSSIGRVALDSVDARGDLKRRARGRAVVLGGVVAAIAVAGVAFLRPRQTSVLAPTTTAVAPPVPDRNAVPAPPATPPTPAAVPSRDTAVAEPQGQPRVRRARPASTGAGAHRAGPPPAAPKATGDAPALAPLDQLRLDQLINERN